MKWFEKKRVLETWLNNSLKDECHITVPLIKKDIYGKLMFRAVEKRDPDIFCSGPFRGKWSTSRSNAYDTFLKDVHDRYEGDDGSQSPKSFSEMRMVNAISTGE